MIFTSTTYIMFMIFMTCMNQTGVFGVFKLSQSFVAPFSTCLNHVAACYFCFHSVFVRVLHSV